MSSFFLDLFNMSISAGWIVLAVLLLRQLLKKAPRWIIVLLWGIVAVRCISPFTFESVLSLIPSAQTVSPEIMLERTPSVNTGIPVINSVINPIIGESFAPELGNSTTPLQILIPMMAVVWLVGVAAMLIYTCISVLRVRRRIGTAVLLRDNIFQSESVDSPFVFGIIRPKIYLPYRIDARDMEHVIAHEKAHIYRKDHWWKPFGFLILALHWFNPLLWLGYALLCRDIELACDEKVIRNLDSSQKADYSLALLACSVDRRLIAACPLAFGEVGVKDRVKSVLNYKKPAFWIVICAVLASIAFAVCFLTNPKGDLGAVRNQISGSDLPGLELEIVAVETSSPDPCITVRFKNKTTDEFIFGDEHYFYRKSDGVWEDCRYNPNNIWSLIAYPVLPKSSSTHTYRLNIQTGTFAMISDNPADNSAAFFYAHLPSGNILTEPGEYRFETEFFIDGKHETKYKAWIEFELTRGFDTISVHTFVPAALVYDDGRYSFTQTADIAPTYRLVNGMRLQEIAADGSVTALGTMERITLGKDSFDSRFWGGSENWCEQETLAGLKRGNYRAWQLTHSKGDEHLLYLLLEQEDGTFYLGFGYYGISGETTSNPDDSHIRWLYRLTSANSETRR
ncbi:MAG: M56 family metallopeptidase [Clostridia bacterium]|nr:M56 family metallopeptidase [Clostridia bacterium]